MITVQEAIDMTLKETSVLDIEVVSLLDASGYVLSEDVYSDIDIPPFDKSAMDGYAVKYENTKHYPAVFGVVGFIPAGVYSDIIIESGQTAKIMTGAPLPKGADCVQMVEKTEPLGNGKVKILESVSFGLHVSKKGEIIQAKSKVFSKGTHITPAVISVLAAVGKEEVQIYQRPKVGILVTGDELVEVHQKPNPGQIRNSNGYTLYHQVCETGANPELFGIAPDNLEELRRKIEYGLKKDVLLISGGVSMGDLDLVEEVFEKLGIHIFYNKVSIKPGKPSVFGRKDNTLVFGLPGNPVSASTVFEIIVKPAMRKMMGFNRVHNLKIKAMLVEGFKNRSNREYFYPARTYYINDQWHVLPIPSKGAADVLALSKSNSFLVVPKEVKEMKKGEWADVMLCNDFLNT
ncbi:MAG: gephyrin-like molybdotransferase Glp [bacterium]